MGKDWNSLGIPEEDRMMRDLLNVLTKMLIVIWTVKFRLRWSQMEIKNFLGTGAKVTVAVL